MYITLTRVSPEEIALHYLCIQPRNWFDELKLLSPRWMVQRRINTEFRTASG